MHFTTHANFFIACDLKKTNSSLAPLLEPAIHKPKGLWFDSQAGQHFKASMSKTPNVQMLIVCIDC